MILKDITHQKVFSILKNKPRGRVLDAGAGKGELSLALREIDFDVISGDIVPSVRKGLRIRKIDLNKKLPFRSSSFDYVIATEVLEHLENPFQIIREFKRILRKKGELYITTSNIANIFSRLKFFLTGTFFAFSSNERKLGHTDPLPYWQVLDILKSSGFKISNVTSNQHLKLSGHTSSSTKFKRVIANLVYYLSIPFVQPKDIDLLKGDSIFVIAKKK